MYAKIAQKKKEKEKREAVSKGHRHLPPQLMSLVEISVSAAQDLPAISCAACLEICCSGGDAPGTGKDRMAAYKDS